MDIFRTQLFEEDASSPYSLDLALSDFFLFDDIKRLLAEQSFVG
jgi:hypothetical protein